jgi:aspartate/methionine/tyrosine aminotransferase
VVAFPRLLDVPAVDDFCHRLMREHGVLLVPGTCFGRPGHVRIGFGGATHELVQGLSALSQLISDVG